MVIESQRLILIPMSLAFLDVSLAGDVAAASELLGYPIHAEWLEKTGLMHYRAEQLRLDPALQPWLLRAVIERETGTMVGHAGFHSAPDPEYLKDIAPEGVEIGYTIYTPFRRQGYATEAFEALMDWAQEIASVAQFVVSIRPDNAASQRMAQRFGFRKVSEHIDPVDGLEEILVRDVEAT